MSPMGQTRPDLAGKLASAEEDFLDELDGRLTAAMHSLKSEDAEAAPACLLNDCGWTRESTGKLQGQYKSAKAFVQIYSRPNTSPAVSREESDGGGAGCQLESRYDSLAGRDPSWSFSEVQGSRQQHRFDSEGGAGKGSLRVSYAYCLDTLKVFAALDIDRSGTRKLPTFFPCSWCDEHNELMSPGHCQGGR